MKHSLRVTTPSEREIVMTREFDAPRSLIYKAFTRPELVQQWLLGPPGWTMPVCEIDLRVGGSYRYVWRSDKDGTEFGTQGEYREIVAPERIVCTERMDGFPNQSLNTLTLVETAGRTSVTQIMLVDSQEVRDAILKTGMEKGVEVSYQRLENVLARTAQR